MYPQERGATTISVRPPRPQPQEPTGPRTPAPRRPGGEFDLAAWVHGIVKRLDETPSEPFEQRCARSEPKPAPPVAVNPDARSGPRAAVHRRPGAPEQTERTSRPDFDLTAWVFGLVPRHEVAEREPAPPRRPTTTKRKALTMPDLFEGPAVPPCLRDD